MIISSRTAHAQNDERESRNRCTNEVANPDRESATLAA